ncbi:Uncharacterized protein TCM_039660 [Theobroma cacao]|uniref:Uncharacterized protein n=1 Tax=Theobroma cacao TaxID=3641 RepID=A0A061GRJ6_THECC|nr:Uncharacterized protein TCM_039660 [Theobroma cacao]
MSMHAGMVANKGHGLVSLLIPTCNVVMLLVGRLLRTMPPMRDYFGRCCRLEITTGDANHRKITPIDDKILRQRL